MLSAIWIHFTVICIFWNSFSIFRFTFEIVKLEPLSPRGRPHLMTATVLLLKSNVWLSFSKIPQFIITGFVTLKYVIIGLLNDVTHTNVYTFSKRLYKILDPILPKAVTSFIYGLLLNRNAEIDNSYNWFESRSIHSSNIKFDTNLCRYIRQNWANAGACSYHPPNSPGHIVKVEN